MTRNDSNTPVVAVVLAAGFGTRFDPDNPKQLVALRGKAIVAWSIEAFESDPRVTDIIVVVNPKVRAAVERMVDEAGYPKVRMIIDGGAQRVDSTMAALDALAAAGIPDHAKVLIHDAVRPFVSHESIDGCIDSLDEYEAATVAVASTDTVLLTRDLGDRKVVADVPDRPDTFRAQTPQAFRFARRMRSPATIRISIPPTTRAWWWITCPTCLWPSSPAASRISRSPRLPTCRLPSASPSASSWASARTRRMTMRASCR